MGETLDSVLLQEIEDWECLVIDDGSTDRTVELMDFYTQRDKRIKYYFRPAMKPKGANSCRNFGFDLSRGKYIQWLDSDDLISSKKIKAQVDLLDSHDGSLATCKWGKILETGKSFIFENLQSYKNFQSPPEFLNTLTYSQGYFPIHAYLMKRTLIDKAGLWLEGLEINQDGEFISRIFCHINKVYFSGEGFVLYRRDSSESTSNIDREQFTRLINSWTRIEKNLESRFEILDLNFVQEAKRRIFIKYRGDAKLIEQNKEFFGSIPEEEPSDLKLNIYRMIVRFAVSRNLLRLTKNLRRGRFSFEK